MKLRTIKVRVKSEEAYWKGQVRRLRRVEKAAAGPTLVRVSGTELVFASLADMARALTPKRLDLMRLIRKHRPASIRELAHLAGRDAKNVMGDVQVLENLGFVESEGERRARCRRALRSDIGRIEVQVAI